MVNSFHRSLHRWVNYRCGFLPVDRSPLLTTELIGRATQVLKRGMALAIFAEGHTGPHGRLARFKQGAAYLALSTGTPVLPAGLALAHKSYALAIGPPVTFPAEERDYSGTAVKGVTARIRAEVKRQMDRAVSCLPPEVLCSP